jgi:hypothetical protein
MTIWHFCGHLLYFSPFWHIVPRKIWQPWYAIQKAEENVWFLIFSISFLIIPELCFDDMEEIRS